MQAVNWNKLRDWAHKTSVEHGFYEDKPSNIHFLCLIVSELMEAVEADRKNHRAKIRPSEGAPGTLCFQIRLSTLGMSISRKILRCI